MTKGKAYAVVHIGVSKQEYSVKPTNVGYNRVGSGMLSMTDTDCADLCRVCSRRLLKPWESKTCKSMKSGTWKANPSNDSSTLR